MKILACPFQPYRPKSRESKIGTSLWDHLFFYVWGGWHSQVDKRINKLTNLGNFPFDFSFVQLCVLNIIVLWQSKLIMGEQRLPKLAILRVKFVSQVPTFLQVDKEKGNGFRFYPRNLVRDDLQKRALSWCGMRKKDFMFTHFTIGLEYICNYLMRTFKVYGKIGRFGSRKTSRKNLYQVVRQFQFSVSSIYVEYASNMTLKPWERPPQH